MEQAIFYCQFFKDIRVRICWERLFQTVWQVEETTVYQWIQLDQVVLPWYICGNSEVPYHNPAAVPLRLGKIWSWLPYLTNRWRVIDQYCRIFSAIGAQPVSFEMPVYCLPNGLWLALDCSHRISALAITQPSFQIKIKGISGPLDFEILPDLRFWMTNTEGFDMTRMYVHQH